MPLPPHFVMLKEITLNKSCLDFDDPEINRMYDMFMINRYLSMKEAFLPLVQDFNHSGVPKNVHYAYFKTVIPKNFYKFNYIKKTQDQDLKKKLKCISRYFEIGLREAKDYLSLLKPEQIKQIVGLYSYGKSGKQTAV